jgi:hypothetical protein
VQAVKQIDLDQAVLKTLSYFDMFHYPLRLEEIHRFLDQETSIDELMLCIETLCYQKFVFRLANYFSVTNDPALIDRRKKGNAEALKLFPEAQKQADLIWQFPFVRAVMASGSMSKDYMDEHSDLDFFIVTKQNHLWLCRMILVMYKRLFLKNSHKRFCVNYFVDEAHLEIGDKNIFTATELATVIPLRGTERYHELMDVNGYWLRSFFPNYQRRRAIRDDATSDGIKRGLEALLRVIAGKWTERWFMRLTIQRWKKLYEKSVPEHDFQVAFRSTTSVSKNHPRNYQKRVLENFQHRLENIKQNSTVA